MASEADADLPFGGVGGDSVEELFDGDGGTGAKFSVVLFRRPLEAATDVLTVIIEVTLLSLCRYSSVFK